MFLNPQILSITILDIIFLIFGTVVFFLSLQIYFKWDFNSSSPLQYKLEKQSFLNAVIIKYIFYLKLPLFLFFIFTLDSLSDVITGAMCAAGVIDATSYGMPLFILKIANIYLFGFWLLIHHIDMRYPNLEFTKLKFGYFLVIFVLFVLEIYMELALFNSIDISKMVSCCGTLYSASATSAISSIFNIDSHIFVYIFYGSYFINLLFYKIKNAYGFTLGNIVFLIISIVSLIRFFSPYIYELPTHHCPFCILQGDYYYIGYILYITLFAGTFYGMVTLISKSLDKQNTNYFKISIIFSSLYVLIVTTYPIIYYIKNGVWLN